MLNTRTCLCGDLEQILSLALYHLSALDLTVISCASRGLDASAAHDLLWKFLWRRRYGRILWSVPALLRNADTAQEVNDDPMRALHSCLKDLRQPPCWWDDEQQPYSSLALEAERRLGPRKRWKAFYFNFGMHW